MSLDKIKPLLFLLFVTFFFACEKKKSVEENVTSSANPLEWKEMDAFHMIMAEAFHPYKDSSDLKPAKEISGEMAEAANEWKNSTLPEKMDNEETRKKLSDLAALASQFQVQVGENNDEITGNTLTELHDLFHDLQNDWYGAPKGEEHHDHGHDHGHDHEHEH